MARDLLPTLAKLPSGNEVLLNHFLQSLQSQRLDNVASRLRLDGNHLTGLEWVRPCAALGRGLGDALDLEQARNGEHTGAFLAQLLLEKIPESLKYRANLLPAQAGRFGQCRVNG